MSTPILQTKFFFPLVRPNLVSRPRLIERLNEGVRGPLTLIAAPAGYGKTTLIGEWRAGRGRSIPVAWLSLDAGDNDPARFWFYLISALDTLQSDQVVDALMMLGGPQLPPIESLLTVLINNLSAFPNDFVLALDDVHLITDPEIFRGIDFLLEHLPLNMHLVLLTRADPPIALSRLRARGQLAEIRTRDLGFTPEEAAQFLNGVMELSLSIDDVIALKARTEGWIAALKLAALSMRGREDIGEFVEAFTGSHHYIVDYLIEEVLNRQPDPVREFLLQTSILDRMSGSLCDALTGESDGQVTLEYLEHANLFLIPLDDERGWYRYHHLFADLLRNRLQRVHPGRSLELHCRAAAWLEENNTYNEAIDHYQAAGEFSRAAALIKLGIQRIFPGQNYFQHHLHRTMLRWLKAFPKEVFNAEPKLHLLYAQCLWFLGRRTMMERHFLDAQQVYDRLVSTGKITPENPDFKMIPIEILAGRSMSAIYAGNHELAVELAEEALTIGSSDNLAVQSDVYISLYLAYRELGALDKAIDACLRAVEISRKGNFHSGVLDGMNGLGFMLQIQGRLRESAQIFHDALQYAEEHYLMWISHVPVTYFRLSDLHIYWDDLSQAECYLNKGFELCENFDHVVMMTFGKIFQARLLLAQGKKQEALEMIQEVESAVSQQQISAFNNELESNKARIQASLGDCSSLASWLEKIDLGLSEQLGIWQGMRAIQAAHVLVSLNRIQEALDLLTQMEMAAKSSGSLTCQIEALAVQAVAWQKKGEMPKALEVLNKAIALAAPEGYMRIFLNEGEPMRELLTLASSSLKEGQLVEHVGQLLDAFSSTTFETGRRPSQIQQLLVEPLSERELEVLRLVAAGKSNQEIADELVIALGTVKRHIFNIYNKLDVKNRTECVAQARALQMLE